MERTESKVLVTTCLSHGLIHVYELSVPPLLLLIQAEFGAGDFLMGRIVAFYGLCFGLGALPAGYLVDRIGSRTLLVCCLWGSSASVVGMAVSPSLGWFAVCAALMGSCLSIYHPAGTALLTHAMPVRGKTFALHGMAGNLGVAGAAALAGGLGAWLGWRGALGALAVGGVLLGFRALTLPAPSARPASSRTGHGGWASFAWLLVAIAFMGMVYRGMTTFLPKLFAASYPNDATMGTAVGGGLTTLALLVGLAGMYAAGRWIDSGVQPARIFLASALLQIPFLVAVGFVNGRGLLPLMMGVAFFHFFTQPAGNHLVADLTPPHLRGLGYGIYFFLSFGVGAAGAAIGGWASERMELALVFPVLAVLLVPSVAAAIVLTVRGRNRPGASANAAAC